MMTAEELASAIRAWAPNLENQFNSLAYLGSESSINWIGDSTELESISHHDGLSNAAHIWIAVIKNNIIPPTPAFLLILEHFRQNPADAAYSLRDFNFSFSKTLANVAYRAADAVYEDAKKSFAGDEIDVAIARGKTALSEFRFSIESQQLTDVTRRIATGKYAAAVAMMGRWIDLPPDAVSRALSYSHESMTLGNQERETLIYRLELQILRFDQTGDTQRLKEALALISTNQNIAQGSELAEAEILFRLAQLSEPGSPDARSYLDSAQERISIFRPRSGVEEARRSVLLTLVSQVKQARITVSARSTAIPRGLLTLMATAPSSQLWEAIRNTIKGLEYLRHDRDWVPAAALSVRFLRQMVSGPAELLSPADVALYVEITKWLSERIFWNRHFQWEAGAAALSAAKRTSNRSLALHAQQTFETLATKHATWPLPQIGIARVQDYLAGLPGSGNIIGTDNWRGAAELALKSLAYGRSNLGGRNEVFAVADARGFLSETFVFKRTTKAKAEYEAEMLSRLRAEINRLGYENRFEVPRSLAIVEVSSQDERRWVHVSQRAAGRLVSELRQDEISSVLEPIVDLLAIFHCVAGKPEAERSGWRPLKDYLNMWSKTLFSIEQAGRFVDSLRQSFPANLPLVRKRDGHASNWLVDPAGRIVAIDLESNDFLPIGYDVAQLIEDNALIQANSEGWSRRLELLARYTRQMGATISTSDLSFAYGWFSITRALRLGTEREAGKQLRRHARELCGMLVEHENSSIREIAQNLLQALSRIEQTESTSSAPSHDHRRLSKSMAYQLRHSGPASGVPVDGAGFAEMDDLALALKVETSQLLAVAEHPGEPRFQVRDGRIRALYGHSLVVTIEAGIDVGEPTALYHGSSWEALDAIVDHGLIPMQRRMVHLTNNVDEAAAVGERKGPVIVLTVYQSGAEEPVADGIWVIEKVIPQRLAIANPFAEEGGVVR
jgi:RNA:NAD 2'-phosphotransferase (TPT1/KptA family)